MAEAKRKRSRGYLKTPSTCERAFVIKLKTKIIVLTWSHRTYYSGHGILA
jgi:hypothetical protein